MRFEFQRLMARGPGAVAARVIIDVNALVRRRDEVDPTYDLWPDALRAVTRSGRPAAWHLGPSCDGRAVEMVSAVLELTRAGAQNVVNSRVPLARELQLTCFFRRSVTVVTAGVEQRPWELWILDAFVESVLDVETGVLWDRARVARDLGEPRLLPVLHAIADGVDGGTPLGTRTAARHRGAILAALLADDVATNAKLLPSLRDAIGRNASPIASRADFLRGHRRDTVDQRQLLLPADDN